MLTPGRSAAGPGLSGVTLVELLVGLTILCLGLLTVAPSMSSWLRNAQVRAQAESLQNGLHMARAEAVRRNTPVRFQLTSDLSDSCTLVTTGTQWVINLGSSVSPAAHCASAISDSASPFLLQRSAGSSGLNSAQISASQSTLAFDSLGRLLATSNPNTSAGSNVIFQVTLPGATCLALAGPVRCLNLVVSPGGQVRLCDPSLSSSQAADRAQAC
ncbi:GspH/FimT family pseudopilin [Curvibacter sp. RS43]|uniref:GspH/FimT family pseudopilin n=1 Tax=Curvibacter microcysteis TaxID=3026419 RepID=UPI00235E2089|nr:GspH/FimT family pseudopilin [Curvibacter sp. RS43]MDD0812588.1 GspH/FimT family pseudopilin [Curvibacter sp. RS43]